eukprot:129497-Alexandrium_andersonii.AAC.1
MGGRLLRHAELGLEGREDVVGLAREVVGAVLGHVRVLGPAAGPRRHARSELCCVSLHEESDGDSECPLPCPTS